MIREKLLTKAVQQPALLFLILIPFPFVRNHMDSEDFRQRDPLASANE